MLRGEDGHQRKEIEKLAAWLRTEPRARYRHAAELASDRPGPADPRGCRPPRLLHAARRGSVPRQSPGALPRAVARTDSRASPARRSLRRRQRILRRTSCARYLGIPAHKMYVVPLGINLEGLRSGPALPRQLFHCRIFRAHRPGEGTAPAGRCLHSAAARDTDFSAPLWKPPAISRPSIATICSGIEKQDEGRRPGARVPLSRRARPRA